MAQTQARLKLWETLASTLKKSYPDLIHEETLEVERVTDSYGSDYSTLTGFISISEVKDGHKTGLLRFVPYRGGGFELLNFRARAYRSHNRGPRRKTSSRQDGTVAKMAHMVAKRLESIRRADVERVKHEKRMKDAEAQQQARWTTKKAAIRLALKGRPGFNVVDENQRGVMYIEFSDVEAKKMNDRDTGIYTVEIRDIYHEDYTVAYASDYKGATALKFSGKIDLTQPAVETWALMSHLRALVLISA
jgi:hypothetical protein